MLTEMRIDGANCPMCLDATVDALRAIQGVREVTISGVRGFVSIEHEGLPTASLAATVHDHLHGIDMYGAEIEMVSIDPIVVDLRCSHDAQS